MPGPASSVRIELPFPPSQLSPNARVHWRTKAKVVADYREACGWIALHDAGEELGFYGLRKPLTPPVRAVVTFVVPTRHKRDEDNLLAMLKPAWDGLVDAGVLAGDDSERFSVESTEIVVRHDRWVPVEGSRLVTKSQSCVIVVLRSL